MAPTICRARSQNPRVPSSDAHVDGGPVGLASGSGESVKRARNEDVEPHDGRRMGQVVHRAIGRLLEGDVAQPAAEDILAAVEDEPLLRAPHVYRLAARQRLIAAVSLYFRLFAPSPSEWRFVD